MKDFRWFGLDHHIARRANLLSKLAFKKNGWKMQTRMLRWIDRSFFVKSLDWLLWLLPAYNASGQPLLFHVKMVKNVSTINMDFTRQASSLRVSDVQWLSRLARYLRKSSYFQFSNSAFVIVEAGIHSSSHLSFRLTKIFVARSLNYLPPAFPISLSSKAG